MGGRRCARSESGQATVEAAFLLPVLLAGMILALQPGILLYNRAVMEAAAADACRLLETLSPGSELMAQAYVMRRLDAVPSADAFHVGLWDVEVSGDEASEAVSVRIRHTLKPLPLAGVVLRVVGFSGADGLCWQEVSSQRSARDTWIFNSQFGPSPEEWILYWEGGA